MSKVKIILMALVIVLMAGAVFAQATPQDPITQATAAKSGVRWGVIGRASCRERVCWIV